MSAFDPAIFSLNSRFDVDHLMIGGVSAVELAAEWKRRPRKGEFVVIIGPANAGENQSVPIFQPDASHESDDNGDENAAPPKFGDDPDTSVR